MADTQLTNEGANVILDSGVSGACKFGISSKTAEELGPTAKLSTVNEITGTAYSQISQTAPSAASQKKTFSALEWKTESHTDWSSSAKSVFLVIGGVLVYIWNLREGGGARDLSGANTTEVFTPVLGEV